MNNIIDLQTAMDYLWEAKFHVRNMPISNLPYFFMLGAGVSVPEIKSASGIINECKNLIKEMYDGNEDRLNLFNKEAEAFENNIMKYYSFWFEKAFRNKDERKVYLEKMIQDSKISSANLLLAQILISKQLSTSVITTNFDDKLYHALSLFGEHDIFVADNDIDNMAVKTFSERIQIIHLHGTYHLYDCCNLEPEIENVTNASSIMSSSNIVAEFLKHKSPIVIGYSGWENDVFMTKLRERLQCSLPSLPYNLIWFCYNKKDYEILPNWLTSHSDIRFVLPVEKSLITDQFLEDSEIPHNKEKKVLSAVDVLNAISFRFKIELPTIFINPFKYYSDVVTKYVPQNEDIFNLNRWVKRMKIIEQSISGTEKLIKDLELAISKNDYDNIILNIRQLSNEQLIDKDDSLYMFIKILLPYMGKNKEINEVDKYRILECMISFVSKKEIFFTDLYMDKTIINTLIFIMESDFVNDKKIILYDNIIMIFANNEKYIRLMVATMGIKSSLLPDNESLIIQDNIIEIGELHKEDIKIIIYVMMALKKKYIIISDVNEREHIKEKLFNYTTIIPNNEEIIEKWYEIITYIIEYEIDDENTKLYECERILKLLLEKDTEKYVFYLMKVLSIKVLLIGDNDKLELYNEYIKYEDSFLSSNNDDLKSSYIEILDAIIVVFSSENNLYETKIVYNKIRKIYDSITLPSIYIVLTMIEAIYYNYNINDNINEREELLNSLISICNVHSSNKIIKKKLITALADLYELTPIDKKEKFLHDYNEFKDMILSEKNVDNALKEYEKGNYEMAEKLFYQRFIIEKKFWGIDYDYTNLESNLAYMKRKGYAKEIKEDIFELLRETEKYKNDAFRCINLALCYIEGFNCSVDWEKAILEFKNIKKSINEAIDWWSVEEYVGLDEKYLVLYLLYRCHHISEEQIHIPIEELTLKCHEMVELPDNFDVLISEENYNNKILNSIFV